MKLENLTIAFGVILTLVAVTLLLLEPGKVVTEPEPRFNVEVHSFENGSAEFNYVPVEKTSSSYIASYEALVDEETEESISNRTYSNISRYKPIKIYVNASPKQTVALNMKIWSPEGQLLHKSQNVIGPAN